MSSGKVREAAEVITRRAQRQGFILPREIREELAQAGLAEARRKEVLDLARTALHYRGGKYYYQAPVTLRVRQEQSRQRDVRAAVRQLIKQQRAAASQVERREEDRVEFIQQVKAQAEDGREHTLLSRDLSPTGIRLISGRRFLGQKLRLTMPGKLPTEPWVFVVRILWTCAVGDDLFENGGVFLDREA